MHLLVGQALYGFCGGHFGRDSYMDKHVEAIGVDWVVARDTEGYAHFYQGDLANLAGYTTKPEDDYL